MKRTGPTNRYLKELIQDLKRESHKQKANIWKRVALDLEKPARTRRVVNLSRLSRYTGENETVIVPGKVLGAGILSHSITVAAFAFSQSAKEQIESARGKCLSIRELIKQNPAGKNIRVIG